MNLKVGDIFFCEKANLIYEIFYTNKVTNEFYVLFNDSHDENVMIEIKKLEEDEKQSLFYLDHLASNSIGIVLKDTKMVDWKLIKKHGVPFYQTFKTTLFELENGQFAYIWSAKYYSKFKNRVYKFQN